MTLDCLQSIVLRLANNGWCRYWVNWSGAEHPIMAVQVINSKAEPQEIIDAESHGLIEHRAPGMDDWIYTVPRTNADGTPYRSLLE